MLCMHPGFFLEWLPSLAIEYHSISQVATARHSHVPEKIRNVCDMSGLPRTTFPKVPVSLKPSAKYFGLTLGKKAWVR